MALRCAAPIYVAEDVMDEAGAIFKDESGEGKAVKKISPADVLKQKLEKAVIEER